MDYFYQHLSSIPRLSIGELSAQLGVSSATLSRFARHVGYRDFKELKTAILEQTQEEPPAQKLFVTLDQPGTLDVAALLSHQQYCLAKTIENSSSAEAERAVEAMVSARKVFLYGKGAAHWLSGLLQFRLNRFSMQTVLLPGGGSELFEALVHAGEGDIVVLFGFSKLPREARVILRHSKKAGYRTVLITSMLFNGEADRADINLFVYRGEASEYHSMAAPAALVDALVVLIAERLGETGLQRLKDLYQLKELYFSDIPR